MYFSTYLYDLYEDHQNITLIEIQLNLKIFHKSKIENLDHLQYLDTINLSNNYITKIENLCKLN